MTIESMVRALRVQGLQPREKLVLLGICNHDGDGGAWPSEQTLAAYAGCTDRQVRRLVESLVGKGYVTVEVNAGGNTKTRGDRRPNLYTLHWERVDISSTTGGHSASERVDIQTSTETPSEPPPETSESSSLRSEEPDAKVAKRAIATRFWDWHLAENGGPPAQKFGILMSVAIACLKRGYPDDEILDAMKLERRGLTAAKVIDRIGQTRRENEGRPATSAIPGEIVRAMLAAKPWFERRWQLPWIVSNWPRLMQVVAANVRRGYGIGETLIRLAIAMRQPERMEDAFWLMNIDIPRFSGELADVPGSMEVAYKNRGWKA